MLDFCVNGVCFIGFIVIVKCICKIMVDNFVSGVFLIVEIGGLNVMIVDFIVLLEQVVIVIVESVF